MEVQIDARPTVRGAAGGGGGGGGSAKSFQHGDIIASRGLGGSVTFYS